MTHPLDIDSVHGLQGFLQDHVPLISAAIAAQKVRLQNGNGFRQALWNGLVVITGTVVIGLVGWAFNLTQQVTTLEAEVHNILTEQGRLDTRLAAIAENLIRAKSDLDAQQRDQNREIITSSETLRIIQQQIHDLQNKRYDR